MKEYTELKERISNIIEKSNNDKPACKNCEKYVDGGCSLGCVNERNGHKYHFNNIKITTPDYACNCFRPVYNLSENTKDTLRNLIEDIDRVNESITNLDLLLDGKINEDEFNEILK
jgi:hypothetical protein